MLIDAADTALARKRCPGDVINGYGIQVREYGLPSIRMAGGVARDDLHGLRVEYGWRTPGSDIDPTGGMSVADGDGVGCSG